jgi:hypothetical protein
VQQSAADGAGGSASGRRRSHRRSRWPTWAVNALQQPSPEQIVEAAGGSMADKLRARYNAISATEEFPVPGWELPSGEPGLIVVARAFGDRSVFNEGRQQRGVHREVDAQAAVRERRRQREEIEGGWGPKLAEMIGVKVAKAADLVALVISKPDPREHLEAHPERGRHRRARDSDGQLGRSRRGRR